MKSLPLLPPKQSFARQASPERPRRCSIPFLLFFFAYFAARCAQAQNSTTVSITEIGGGAITLQNNSVRTSAGNNSCIIVGCDSRNSRAGMYWWNFYSKTEYVTTQIRFDGLLHKGKPVSPNWCRIPSVIHELERFPGSRVLYIDTDTRVNYTHWCNTSPRALGPMAPIIMNSVYRKVKNLQPEYTVYGTQVQTNVFLAAPGDVGVKAMRRWEDLYHSRMYQDQGAIHILENGLCGVPGWIHCAANGQQQGCHCTGTSQGMKKVVCIRKLFEGKVYFCPYKTPAPPNTTDKALSL